MYLFVFAIAGSYYLFKLCARDRTTGRRHAATSRGQNARAADVVAEDAVRRHGELIGYPFFPSVWFGIIGFGVMMYVLSDGFVLGIGILAPFSENKPQQHA